MVVRRSGVGADLARGGAFDGRLADLDWDNRGHRSRRRGRTLLLQGHAQSAPAPVLRGDQLDSDAGGGAACGDRAARIERGAVAAIEQDGDGSAGPIVATSFSFLFLCSELPR